MLKNPDLDIWTVECDDDGEQICMGRAAAEAESLRSVRLGAHKIVCARVTPSSPREADLLADAHIGNGTDLLGALLPLATARGLDVEPERCDPYALLLALRGLATLTDAAVEKIASDCTDAIAEVMTDALCALGFTGEGSTFAAEEVVYNALRARLGWSA